MSISAQRMPEEFASMQTSIEENESRLEKLVTLHALLNANHEAFFASEHEFVQDEIRNLIGKIESDKNALAEKIAEWEDKVVKITQTLNTRKELLDQFESETKFLSEDSEILQLFAAGHVSLEGELESSLGKLNIKSSEECKSTQS